MAGMAGTLWGSGWLNGGPSLNHYHLGVLGELSLAVGDAAGESGLRESRPKTATDP